MSPHTPEAAESNSPGDIPGLSFVWPLLWLMIAGVYVFNLPDRVSIDSGIYTALAFGERWHPHHLLWSWFLYGLHSLLPGAGMAAVATGTGVAASAGCAVAVGWLLQHRAGWPAWHAIAAAIVYAALPLQLTMMAQWEAYTLAGLLMLVGAALISHPKGWCGWRFWAAVLAFSGSTLLHQKLCLAVPVFSLWLWLSSRGRTGLVLVAASGGLCLTVYLFAHRVLNPGGGFVPWLFAYGERYGELGRLGNFISPREIGRLGWNVGAAWIPGLPALPKPLGAAIGLGVLVLWGGAIGRAMVQYRHSIAFPLAVLWVILQLLILWWLPILQTMQWLCLAPGFVAAAIALKGSMRWSERRWLTGAAVLAAVSILLHQNTLMVAWRFDHRPDFGNHRALRVAHYPYSQSYHVEVALFESGKRLAFVDWEELEEPLLAEDEALVVDRSVVIRPAGVVAATLERLLGRGWRETAAMGSYVIRETNREVDAPLPAGIILGGRGAGDPLAVVLERWVRGVEFLDDQARTEWLAMLNEPAQAAEGTPPPAAQMP